MAEALLNSMCGEKLEAHSAGITAGELNPVAVEAMQEIGIDISHHKPEAVFDLYKNGTTFQYVISLCNEASGEKCPTVPGFAKRVDWSFEDPAIPDSLPPAERLARMRSVRDQIKNALSNWCSEICH